ncbi:MAG TPA: DUF4038 domain-containing protein [Bacteroidales bacterium]|nr:DUF4038 domain-containing protein [Bacteroidales bacterium]
MVKKLIFLIFGAIFLIGCQKQDNLINKFLKISENGRYLKTKEGKPFLYLGCTAWELFHRLNREEATEYLKNRADKGPDF